MFQKIMVNIHVVKETTLTIAKRPLDLVLPNPMANPCTQMAIRFSIEMKIESKYYSIAIFIYFKIEKKKFNTNVLLFIFFIQIARK